MKKRQEKVWLNGSFVEAGAHISTNDRGFLLGDGAFETILLQNKSPAFLTAHIQRLQFGLQVLRIPEPDFSKLPHIFKELSHANNFEHGRCVARITISRGEGGRGLAPTFTENSPATILVAVSAAPGLPKTAMKVCISNQVKYSKATTIKFKSLSGYTQNLIARYDASAGRYDDAILLNEHGRVACATSANIFTLDESGCLRTPPCAEGALPGVVREVVLKLASEVGLKAVEEPIQKEDLRQRRLLLTNSLIGVREVYLENSYEVEGSTKIKELSRVYEKKLETEFAGAGIQP